MYKSIHFLLTVLCVWLGWVLPLNAVAKTFLLTNRTVELDDVTATVEIYLSSLRLNPEANQWSFEIRPRNTAIRPLTGELIVLVEDSANIAGIVAPDGHDEDDKPWWNLTDRLPPTGLATGAYGTSRTLVVGVANGVPRLNWRVYAAVAPTGPALAFVQTLDEFGQPLPGVTVIGSGPDGSRTNHSDSTSGVATLGQGSGTNTFHFSAPEHLPVWRFQDLSKGTVCELSAPRLTRRMPGSAISPVGGTLSNGASGIHVIVPPGALQTSSVLTLTPLTAQTLPALLPLGWSPLQAFWLETTSSLTGDLPVTLPLWSKLGTDETGVLVRWDETSLSWKVVRTLSGLGTEIVNTALTGPGAWVVVLGDVGAGAPPAPQMGSPLAPVGLGAFTDWSGLVAEGRVEPGSSPASTVGELVTGTGRLVVAHTNSLSRLPSGTLFRGLVHERYQMQDGSLRITPAYGTYFSAYQRPGDTSSATLEAKLPLRPQLLLGADQLLLGTVTLDVFPPTEFAGAVLTAAGGTITSGPLHVRAAAGALLEPTAVQLTPLDPTAVTTLNDPYSTAAAFQLVVGELASGARLSLEVEGLATNVPYILARVLASPTAAGLEPVERFRTDANGRLQTMEPGVEPRLPGLTEPGQYLLVRIPSEVGLVTGVARNSQGEPAGGLPVRITGQPWLTFSAAPGGGFRLVAPVGSTIVGVTDPASGDTGTMTVQVTNPAVPAAVEVATSALGPRVVSVNPADASTQVAPITGVTLHFDKPLRPDSVSSDAIALVSKVGSFIPVTMTLNLAGTEVTLLPRIPLAGNTVHTVSVATNVLDLAGRPLVAAYTASFTTASDTLNRGAGAQLISYEPTNGVALIKGTQGFAEAGQPVVLLNETTGRTATTLAGADGSFTNSLAMEVDDRVSAVVINRNGTRNELALSRQLFSDGRVGLYKGGGIVEVTNEYGTAQFIVEPGAIEKKTVFKVEALSLPETHDLLGNTEPENGKVLGGFKLAALQGSPLSQPMDVSIPLPVEALGLPAGVDPTNATFGLTIARVVDGEQVFELVDSMHYEGGRLVTHSPPFSWIVDLAIDFVDEVLIPVLLSIREPATLVHGRVYSVHVDLNNQPDLSTKKNLSGAIVSGPSSIIGAPRVRGRLLRGAVYAVSSADGSYALLTPTRALSAIHPLFPGKNADGNVPRPSTNSPPLNELDLRFAITQKGPAPTLQCTHFPLRQDPGKTITLKAESSDDSVPIVNVKILSVTALIPGEVVEESDIVVIKSLPEPTSPPTGFGVIQRASFKSPRAAVINLLISAVDGTGNETTQPYTLQFSEQPPPPTAGPIPPSDPKDKKGPMVLWSIPEAKGGKLVAGNPIVIKFNEAINPGFLNQATPISIQPLAKAPQLQLNEDQTLLTIQYLDLAPGTDYTLTLASIDDLKGNLLDQNPAQQGDQAFVMKFTTGTVPSGFLVDPTVPKSEGVGAVVHGHHAFVAERNSFPDGNVFGNLVIYDLSNPQSPLTVAHVPMVATPRDLLLIPHYSFVYVPESIYQDPNKRRQVKRTDFTSVLTRDLVVVVGGTTAQRSILRVIDVTEPAKPVVLAGTRLSDGNFLPSRIRWSAPTLAYLEVSDQDRISSINLQSYLIGSLLAENPAEYAKLGEGNLGHDENQDGDYVDVDDVLPLPSSKPPEFAGKVDSFGIFDSTQGIRDIAIEERGTFKAALVFGGYKRGPDGTVQFSDPVERGYRTLLNNSTPVALDDGYYAITNGSPRRLFTLFRRPIRMGQKLELLDLALITVNSPPNSGTNYVLVLNITNRLKPKFLLEIPVPTGPGSKELYSIESRADGQLIVASDTVSFVINPEKFAAGIADPNKVGEAIVSKIPDMGGDGLTFGVFDSGVIVSGRMPERPAFVVTPQIIEIVAFPETDPFDPGAWITGPAAPSEAEILDRLRRRETAASLRLARYKEETGYCDSTLKAPLTQAARRVHYYALVRAPSGSPGKTSIELAMESLNWAGAPLKKRGFLFPPVHAFSAPVLASSALDQDFGPEDASVRPCTAYRLSNKPDSPLFNTYLSRPFALVGESLSKKDLDDLDSTLKRDILWSGHYLRVSIDPSEQSDPILKPFAGEVTDNQYHPGVSTILPSLPGDLLPSPNPMPINGGETIALAGGFVGAHNSELIVNTVDLGIPGRRLPVAFGRHYSGQALYHGPFGRGWDINYNQRLVELAPELIAPGFTNPIVVRSKMEDSEYATNKTVLFYNADGRILVYNRWGSTPPPEIAKDPLAIQLNWVGTGGIASLVSDYYAPPPGVFSPLFKFKDGRFALLEPDGTQRWFNSSGRLIKIQDRFESSSIEVGYGVEGEIVSIQSDGGTAADPFILKVGYYRNPNPGPPQDPDLVTTKPSRAGRICRLTDYTGRDVLFEYNNDDDLLSMRGVEVSKVGPAPNNLGVTGRQETIYTYSAASDPLSRKSLNAIRGPNREPVSGGVPTLTVVTFASPGPDMVETFRLGTSEIKLQQTHENTAKALSLGPRHTVVNGPMAGGFTTILNYDFDLFGRPEKTEVTGGSYNPITTGITYYDDGLVKEITYPEKDFTTYEYDSVADSLRSRANVKTVTKNPGPRVGHALKADSDYDEHYNLLSGVQHDFRGIESTIALSTDFRWVKSVTKGGETESIDAVNSYGQVEKSTDALGFPTELHYTPEGFLESQSIGDPSDPLTTSYKYLNPSGRRGKPSEVKDPTKVAAVLVYDELDRVIESTRSDAYETMSYDGAGNLRETTTVVEVPSQFSTNTRTRTDHFEYDDFRHLKKSTVKGVEVVVNGSSVVQDLTTEYILDDYYRVERTLPPSGEEQRTEYDHAGRVVASKLFVNAQLVYERVLHYDGNGNLGSDRFQQAVTTITYDGHDRPIESRSPSGAQTNLGYDGNGNIETRKVVDTLSVHSPKPVLSEVVTHYDDLDRPRLIEQQTEAGTAKTEIVYDSQQKTVTVTDALGGITTSTYTKVGRESSLTGPLGSIATVYTPGSHELIRTRSDGLGPVKLTTRFNDMGHVREVEDAKNALYSFTRGVDGRLLASQSPGTANPSKNSFTIVGLPRKNEQPDGQSMEFSHDSRGRRVLEAPVHPNGIPMGKTSSYDPAGRLASTLDSQLVGDKVGNQTGIAGFDPYGQPLVVEHAQNSSVGYNYDAIGRKVASTYSAVLASTPTSPRFTQGYDAFNRVTGVTNWEGALKIGEYEVVYGKEGLAKEINVTQFGVRRTLLQEFNLGGGRTRLTYPSGIDVIFGRDEANRLTSVEPPGPEPVIEKSTYDAGALVTKRTLGKGVIEVTIGYDANRRETSRTYKRGGALLAEVKYERNAAGLITQRQLTHAGTTDFFTHDDSHRLRRAVIGVPGTLDPQGGPAAGVVPPGAYARTFDYDVTDVMTLSVLQNPSQISVPTFVTSVGDIDHNLFGQKLTFAGTPALVVPRTPDSAGNAKMSRGFIRPREPPSSQLKPIDAFHPVDVTYGYNELDQLVTVQRKDLVKIQNTYGPTGLRIQRHVTGPVALVAESDLEYLYDGINLIEIRDRLHNNRLQARFYYGDNGDELLAGDLLVGGTLERYYYLTDSLGSPMAIADAAGNIIEYYLYDAWGEVTIRPPGAGLTPGALGIHTRSAVESPFFFQGQVYDEDAGLIYMRARYYDPALGAFLQRDPMGYVDSGNQYAGLASNPVNFRDPTGHFAKGLLFPIVTYAVEEAPVLVSILPELTATAIAVAPSVVLAGIGIHDQEMAYNYTSALAEDLAARKRAKLVKSKVIQRPSERHHGWTIYGNPAESYADALQLICGFTGTDAKKVVSKLDSINLRHLEGHRSSHARPYHDFSTIYFSMALEDILKETGGGKPFDLLTYGEKLRRQEACFAFLAHARDELHDDMILFREIGIDIESRKGWTEMWNRAEGRIGKDAFDRVGRTLETKASELDELIKKGQEQIAKRRGSLLQRP